MAPKAKAKGQAKARGSSTPAAPKGKAKGKAKARASSSEPQPPPSPEALAATSMQSCARTFLAKRRLLDALEASRRQEAELAEALRAGEMAMLRIERRQMEERAAKEKVKREKAAKEKADGKKLLTAAFEGDVAEVSRLLREGVSVSTKDANGTTPLSEAACGGSVDAVRVLVTARSDPNSQGEFQRTPLWRAAYAGHLDCVQMLLEAGSDPRLYDDNGQVPLDVSSGVELPEALRSWNVARTDELVADYDNWAEDIRLEEDFRQKQAMRSVDEEFAAAESAHDVAQSALARAKAAMRNRVKEHGLALACGVEGPREVARVACASADAEVQRADEAAAVAQVRYDKANFQRLALAEEVGAKSSCLGRQIQMRDLNDVLLRDLGGRIGHASKWPLLIDPSDCARKLLQYAGCSVMNFWRSEEMVPSKLRVALLTMIRGGGVLAVDLALLGRGVDRTLLAEPFESIRPWLFKELMERDEAGATTLLKAPAGQVWPRFSELVEKDERRTFGVEHFDDERSAKFKFIVLTSSDPPHKDLVSLFEVIRVSAD